jgi:hypothetical protein
VITDDRRTPGAVAFIRTGDPFHPSQSGICATPPSGNAEPARCIAPGTPARWSMTRGAADVPRTRTVAWMHVPAANRVRSTLRTSLPDADGPGVDAGGEAGLGGVRRTAESDAVHAASRSAAAVHARLRANAVRCDDPAGRVTMPD